MTRGIEHVHAHSRYRSCVTDADLPVLRRLLFDRDYVTQLSAPAFSWTGAGGRAVLDQRPAEATEYRARSTIQDALREGRARATAAHAYPLDERERKRIRAAAHRGLNAAKSR